MAKRPTIRATAGSGWSLTAAASPGRGRRRAGAIAPDGAIAALFDTGGLELAATYEATQTARRAAADAPLVIDIVPPDDADYVAVVRLPSGAVTFSFAQARAGRRGLRRGGTPGLRFQVDVRAAAAAPPAGRGRRGLVKRVVKFFLAKVVGKVADVAIELVARGFEEAKWKLKKLPKGLQLVDVSSGAVVLRAVTDKGRMLSGPCLLLVHGTFSEAASAFKHLATTSGSDGRTFFDAVQGRYPGGIYAFNHFTISQDPIENARDLLAALPDGRVTFDAITHSRGALVLRSLLERSAALPLAHRFSLGTAVLVAGPNQGTPLASADRWKQLADWVANVIDLFPDNPFTLGLDFVVEVVTWLARAVGFTLPGLAAMNPQGEFIRALQAAPQPAGRVYAIAANTEPDEGWLARAVDVGVDGFFQMANDLVVPTVGSWRIDDGTDIVSSDRIACFGLAGNLTARAGTVVHHVNYFAQPEAVDVLVAALRGEALGLTLLDPSVELPTRAGRRGAATARAVSGPAPRRRPALPLPAAMPPGSGRAAGAPEYELDEILNLFIFLPGEAAAEARAIDSGGFRDLDADLARQLRAAKNREALIIGSYRNARVFEPFKLKTGELKKRWDTLEKFHAHLKGYVDGDKQYPELPTDDELRDFGAQLFSMLFTGQIRRLYDLARAEAPARRLDVCITSNIGWVAEFPWEFAFDPSRQMYLCMEEVNLLRNISTSVPAIPAPPRSDVLRILVVAAQPLGAGALSIDAERDVIHRAFSELESFGLAKVTVVPRITPEILHDLLMRVDTEPVDVLHFIGHGEFDKDTGYGYLLFENESGQSWRLRADNLRQIACRRGIRLIFLNACETGMGTAGSRLDFAQGAAPMLVAGGVPAVVANQFKVLDLSAATFAQRFYRALAEGLSIANAAREARVAVNYAVDGEAMDWAVPVVFARNPRERLIAGSGASAGASVALSARGQRSTRRSGRRRVGVWDINYRIPALDQTLETFTSAQDVFEFVRADIAAPIGTWHPRARAGHLRPALNVSGLGQDKDAAASGARPLHRHLEAARRRLNVEHLMAFTTFPCYGGGITENLTMYRSVDGRLSVVSIAPVLDDLDDEYPVERLLANFLTFALCDLADHGKPRKTCPMYRNNENEIRYLAGPLHFCAPCAKKLKDVREKRALTALLDAIAVR